MRLTQAQAEEVMRKMWAAPQFPPVWQSDLSGRKPMDLPESVDLYPLMANVPSDRDQGHCGNCWAWGCTGTLEIALKVQNGIRDRLSMQLINSCNPYKSCCGAGGFDDFANFYAYEGFAVPWSNTGANWSSGGGSCIPCANIANTPRYPIRNISYYTIATKGVGQAAAIANIKAALKQQKGLYFYFNVPNQADWTAFDNFYFNQPETAIWNNAFCNDAWDADGGGHVVLCVGYMDDGGPNRYWVMLNSWGAWGTSASNGRPTGKYRISMDIDYDCLPGLGFQAINVAFALAPLITSAPQNLVVTQGQTGSFSIATAPGTPLTYQWMRDGSNLNNSGRISGVTSPTLTITNTSTNDSGSYAVALNYGAGTTNSPAATLTVVAPPYIIRQPKDQGIPEGQNVTLTITAGGTEPLGYRWQWNSTLFGPGTNRFLTHNPGNYCCIVSNAAGVVTSDVAVLSILYKPQFVTQPQSQTNPPGTRVTLSVAATGTEPLSYLWQYGGKTYPGTNTFTTTRAGDYSAIVTNAAGSATSAVATLVFAWPPAQPGHFDGIYWLTNGWVQLSMSGTAYSNYVLESTADWQGWTNLTTLSGANGLFQYTDPGATNGGHRFYRLRAGP